jgi:ammonium transporter, Amt family
VAISAATNAIFVFVVTYAFFKILNKFTPLRVSEELEEGGLDMAEVAVNAYPEFTIDR